MILSVFGFNYRSASLDRRAPFQLQRDELSRATLDFKRISRVEEAVVVASCNRVEFYCADPERRPPAEAVVKFYRARGVEGAEALPGMGYGIAGSAVARHLFRVTSGMDSLILGEEQIRGQIKYAYSAACRAGGPGKVLHKLFHHAFRVSKRIHSETALGDGIRSIPGAAVELLLEGLDPARQRALVIGANETTAVALNHLARRGVERILINRTRAHAEALAKEHGASLVDWDGLAAELSQASLVFAATAAPEPLIRPAHFEGTEEEVRIADLAVPRNVDPMVSILHPAIQVFDLDSMSERLREISRRRYEYLPVAQGMVEEQVEAFDNWLHAQLFAGGIEAVKEEMHAVADEEMARFRGAFHQSEAKALEAFSHALLRRFLKSAAHHFEPLAGPLDGSPAPRLDPAAVEGAVNGASCRERRTVQT